MDTTIDQAARRTLRQDFTRIAAGTAAILLVPLVAMRFTKEVNWTAGDFLAAALLLGGAGGAYVLLARTTRLGRRRVLLGGLVLAALLAVWAELAVGVFGTPFAGS